MKIKEIFRTLFFFLLTVFCLSCNGNNKKTISEEIIETPKDKISKLPNIVFVLVDDMGYGDLGVYGQEHFKTPHIDALADKGLLFTNHYAGSNVCAPSRASLLTGKHVGHSSVRGNSPEGQLLSDDELTLGKMFKKKGYATGSIGKWGVGNHPDPNDPKRNGFDHFYGYINMWHAHNFYPEFLYRNGDKEKLEGNVLDTSFAYDSNMREGTGVAKIKGTYALDLFQKDALDFIQKNKDNPFFLLYSINMPHANNEAGTFTGDGMEVPDYGEFENKDWPNPEKGFARMVQLIDNVVKELEDKIEELGLSDNTIIVFTSDNGPHQEGGHNADFFDSNANLRGYKRDFYEGGINVPLIINWPGKVKKGVTDVKTAFWDWLPTFADIISAEVPVDSDGISFLPTITGSESEQKKHDHFYWEFYEQGGKQALLRKHWKYIKLHVRDSLPVKEELYNLSSDPEEQNNVADSFPNVLKTMDSIMNEEHKEHKLISLFKENVNTEANF